MACQGHLFETDSGLKSACEGECDMGTCETCDDGAILRRQKVDIDWGVTPPISDIHAAFALNGVVTLVDKEGSTYTFRPTEDLDYRGWLDEREEVNLQGKIDTRRAAPFAFYEGRLYEEVEGRIVQSEDLWVIFIEPGGGMDGSDIKCFFWNGNSLELA